ncbi:MAG: hypothetical protein U0163_17085 [Gemmatimonadaceae bacterium]
MSGKAGEGLGDSLDDFDDSDANLTQSQLQRFVASPQAEAPLLLKSATTRVVYDLDRFKRCAEPPFAATLARETHVSDPAPVGGLRIQVAFAYSDGFGRDVQSKIQAEPGDAPQRDAPLTAKSGDAIPGPLVLDAAGKPLKPYPRCDSRWVGKGRTVYNDKGKPVKQYEPFFSSTHLYEPEPDLTDTGVTPILFYDAVARVVATLHPNHTYDKVVFDPWSQISWDVNDTVDRQDPKTDPDVGAFFVRLPDADYLPTWYDRRRSNQLGRDELNAADRAAVHADTPSTAYFDTMGRPFLTLAENVPDPAHPAQHTFFATRVELDIEGNQRSVTDARDRVVMRHDYDLLGNRIHQDTMDAGARWMLNDVSGKSIRGWDSRGHLFRTEFDQLRRPLKHYVRGTSGNSDPRTVKPGDVLYERVEYGEGQAKAETMNLRTQVYKQYDAAGIVSSEAFDFKGNLLRGTREVFLEAYKDTTLPNWTEPREVFRSSSVFDALNRAIQQVAPHVDKVGAPINVIRPSYSEANLLERVDVWLGRAVAPADLLDAAQDAPVAALGIKNIDYDAKGQRQRIDYRNGVSTSYTYDSDTFRLIRLRTTGKNGVVFQDLSYVYDPVGNITHIQDDAQQETYFSNAIARPSNDYRYDALYRLIAADGREFFESAGVAEPTTWNDVPRVERSYPGNPTAIRGYCEEYEYDEVGNFVQLDVHHAGTLRPPSQGFRATLWRRDFEYTEDSALEAGKFSNRLSRNTVARKRDVQRRRRRLRRAR